MITDAIQEEGEFSSYALVSERLGNVGKRKKKEIGVFALRGGGVIGEHQVYFFSENDKVVITHTAFNRKAFTTGVLQAALFLHDKKPAAGMFNMKDVLNGVTQ